jgi:hypothetical protein
MRVIRTKEVPPITFEQWATDNNLTLELHAYNSGRVTAQFKNIEIKERAILCSAYGDATTEAGAIAEYIAAISGQVLVENAYKKNRRVLYAPRFSV